MSAPPPPPMYPPPPPPPQGYAPRPPQGYAPPPPPSAPPPQYAASYPAPEHGPYGAIPTTPGTVVFDESWTRRNDSKVNLWIGVGVTVLGLVGMIGGGGEGNGSLIGAAMFLFGPIFIVYTFVKRKKAVHTDVVCDPHGFTIRKSAGKTAGPPPVRVPWRAVSGTKCYFTTRTDQNSDNGVRTTINTECFLVESKGQTVYSTDESTISRFPAFIEFCNLHTPHLGYLWLPRKAAQGRPVIEHADTYVKVPR